MPIKTIAAMCVGIVTACLPGAAWGANASCGPRDYLLAQLSAKFQEAPVAVGLAANGSLLELLTSPDGSTWTVIVSATNGRSCLLATGSDWQAHERPVEGEPS